MTNTIYFNLDNASYSTSSPGSISSQQQDQEGSEAANVEEFSSSQSTVTDAAKAINAWIHPPSNMMDRSFNLKSFSFTTLKDATRNFRPGAAIQVSRGMVYKGWIDEQTLTASKLGMGIPIAVMFLNREGFQHHKEWLEKVHYIGNLPHPNLVKLLGYCSHVDLRILVYEFMPIRRLYAADAGHWGFSHRFSWGIRMKIALGAAKALAFLHSADIIGIDWGSQNSIILLDSNYEAKLLEFGFLARNGRTGGMLTTKGDVYSFGVVFLEIISGRRAIDVNRPRDEHNLVDWAMLYLRHKRKFLHVLDCRLDGQYSVESAQRAAHLAVQCLANEANLRPNMDVVVTALEQLQQSIIMP